MPYIHSDSDSVELKPLQNYLLKLKPQVRQRELRNNGKVKVRNTEFLAD